MHPQHPADAWYNRSTEDPIADRSKLLGIHILQPVGKTIELAGALLRVTLNSHVSDSFW
jgi:hypothetical protein